MMKKIMVLGLIAGIFAGTSASFAECGAPIKATTTYTISCCDPAEASITCDANFSLAIAEADAKIAATCTSKGEKKSLACSTLPKITSADKADK